MDSAPLASIGDYGLIGDTRTAALVSSAGSIDWLCFPRFDSPPVFGRLVAGRLGGSFDIAPFDVRETERRYLDDSPIVQTPWRIRTHRRAVRPPLRVGRSTTESPPRHGAAHVHLGSRRRDDLDGPGSP